MRAVTVLLVDDDDIDVLSFRAGLAELHVANPVVRAYDGLDALAVLRGQDPQRPLPQPYLIVLDLKMPRMGGLEFLAELRADPDLQRSVVFVLTTSTDDEEKVRVFDHHVAGFIVKSRPAHGFLEVVTLLDHYWRLVELP